MGKGLGFFCCCWFGFFLVPCVGLWGALQCSLHERFSCTEELLSQGQAPLWAPGPLGFCRARSQHHKGKIRHFASVKGTSSCISNIAVLEAFHSSRMILLAFFPFCFWALLFSVMSCLRKERYKQGAAAEGNTPVNLQKTPWSVWHFKKRHRFGGFTHPHTIPILIRWSVVTENHWDFTEADEMLDNRNEKKKEGWRIN